MGIPSQSRDDPGEASELWTNATKLGGEVLGGAVKSLLGKAGLPMGGSGGGGTRNVSSSSSATSVSVNPAISVVTGGGMANPSTSGSSYANPVASADGGAAWEPYGIGTTSYGGGASTSSDDGWFDWLLIGGVALLAFMMLGGGK